MSVTPLWPVPLPSGKVGQPYSYTLSASGGTPPYTYAISSGTLPQGLSLNATTGVISGVPTVIAILDAVTISVTDGVAMNPTKVTWGEPTLNVDGTAIVSGEITGYNLGIRLASGTAGTYPTVVAVSGATTLNAALPPLSAGSYFAALQAVGPNDSAWGAETAFIIIETPAAPAAPVVS